MFSGHRVLIVVASGLLVASSALGAPRSEGKDSGYLFGKGPGTYRFIGGTGKWEGISGVGVTRGMLRERTDDHFMLNSELHWRIEERVSPR